jgi:hypothetical protein
MLFTNIRLIVLFVSLFFPFLLTLRWVVVVVVVVGGGGGGGDDDDVLLYYKKFKHILKVKVFRYKPGVALGVPGG